MAGHWNTFSVPDTSTGAFAADIMLLLTDGSVLVHNGYTTDVSYASQWLRLTPDAAGAYETGSWSGELDMTYARQWFASGVLADGRVFVIGGEDSTDPAAATDAWSGDVFDPQAGPAGTWSALDKPAAFEFVRGDCNGTVLPDGRVLLGGASTSPDPSGWSKLTAIWDPADNSWIQAGLEFGAAGATTKEDPFEEETFSLLADGSVLAPAVRDTPQAQRYVPALDQWISCQDAPVNLAVASINGTEVDETGPTILLPGGAALVIGGGGQTALYTPPPAADPEGPGSWTPGPSLPSDTSASPNWPTLTALDAPACLLPSGKVVLMGGTTEFDAPGYFSQNPVLLEYDPASSATTLPQLDVQPSLPAGNYTWQSAFLLLPTGQLLMSAQDNTLYLYTPDPADTPDPAWAPANISVPATMVTGHTYTLSGTQLNGLSQALCYGDDAGMATNYPIVRLTSPATGQVVYVRSHDFSSMGVATGTAVPGDVQSCSIDIPAGLAPGDWNLVVIANGIASAAVPVQVAGQDCFFIVDNSTFSLGEVDSYLDAHPPSSAVFSPAFYVVVEGYTPAELGIASAAQLASPPVVPEVTCPITSGISFAFAGPVIAQDPSLPPGPQRFTFPFSVTFTEDTMFGPAAVPVTLTADFGVQGMTTTASATITLTPSPNPYILHGDQAGTPSEPWYLSQDLRVFQVVAAPGNNTFGVPIPAGGNVADNAIAFIQSALAGLRNDPGGALAAEFDALPQDEGGAVLQLQPTDGSGHAVYNFALARVRLRDTQDAPGVRVFFRVWQAQQTNAEYNTTTYARATNGEGQPIPVLGVQGDEIITIPFFAQARQAASQPLHLQQDDFNRHDISATPGGETDYFFGCWLDINQPDALVYPQRIEGVSADGPFDTVSPLFPVQQFMVAAHQCLIAEIAYDGDPIAAPADPSTSDKLAQRNLAFVGAPNPGLVASRRVPQTFEVRPTSPELPAGLPPDELMIEWDGVPAGSQAEIYFPAASAGAIVAAADRLYTSHLLTAADAHTLRFPAAGVTYLPVPPGTGVTLAGLLTLDLPEGIRKGQTYAATVRQLTSVPGGAITGDVAGNGAAARRPRSWRRTTGIFRLTVPVSTKALLLEPEERYLSLMKWVSEAIPATSRWYPVMERYLSQISGRVSGMGGDPGQVPATGTGIWDRHHHPGPERQYTGRIERLTYDRFGDFEAFTLETETGEERRLASREPHLAELARRAWQERWRVEVVAVGDCPLSVSLLV
jgi:hypothetical protein